MTHFPIRRGARNLDDVCCCMGDLFAEELADELFNDDLEDDPCPDCGGRVMRCPPPVWMEEEEDDC